MTCCPCAGERCLGQCLYVAGVPGTGKTATVHEVVRQLQQRTGDGELPAFRFVEINALRLSSPQHAYVHLYLVSCPPPSSVMLYLPCPLSIRLRMGAHQSGGPHILQHCSLVRAKGRGHRTQPLWTCSGSSGSTHGRWMHRR